jgi:flagellar hook-basal body complex protein FliE
VADPRISGIGPNVLHSLSRKAGPERAGDGSRFADLLKESVGEVDRLQKQADQGMRDLATGKTESLHQTMIQAEKSEVAFRLLLAVRGKLVTAYQEIMRMQF